MAVEILYEDRGLIAVLKPACVVVHPDFHHKGDTFIESIIRERPEICGVGNNDGRCGLVHRLDKDTSGVLLVAKNRKTFDYLRSLFQKGEIKKTYIALVAGSVRNDEGVIDKPIARSTQHPERRVVGGGSGKARAAVTEYSVKERFGGKFTLLEVRPRTGRTHQIRSHMAHIGHPVACDKVYGGGRYACPAGLKRQFLHAAKLEFARSGGAQLQIEAELPDDLRNVLCGLRKQ